MSESKVRSLAKAISWRITGTLDTFFISWLITGTAKIAGTIALTEICTKILIYWVHERIWVRINWGKDK